MRSLGNDQVSSNSTDITCGSMLFCGKICVINMFFEYDHRHHNVLREIVQFTPIFFDIGNLTCSILAVAITMGTRWYCIETPQNSGNTSCCSNKISPMKWPTTSHVPIYMLVACIFVRTQEIRWIVSTKRWMKKNVFLSVLNWTPEINQGMTTILYQGDGFTELQRCLFWRGKFKWKGSVSFGEVCTIGCAVMMSLEIFRIGSVTCSAGDNALDRFLFPPYPYWTISAH